MGRRLVAVDPGVKLAGVAIFDDTQLMAAYLVRGEHVFDTVQLVRTSLLGKWRSNIELAIEKPQVYVQSKQKGDPNDLIDLAIMVGALAYQFPSKTLYYPRQWKGQVPKDIMVARVKTKLSADEMKRVGLPRAQSLHHNIWDAVGIGLHHRRRMP